MVYRYLKYLLFLLSAPFIYLAYSYQDSFYLIPAAAALLLSFLINTTVFESKKLRLSGINPKIPKLAYKRLLKYLRAAFKKKSFKKLDFKIKSLVGRALVGLFILTSIFVYLTIYILPTSTSRTESVVISFYKSLLLFAKNHKIALLVMTLAVFISVFLMLSKKLKNKIKASFLSLIAIFLSLFVSLNLALGVTYGYAVTGAYTLTQKLSKNPDSFGIITDPEEIVEKLNTEDKPPILVGLKGNFGATLYRIYKAEVGRQGPFFREVIATNLPDFVFKNAKTPNESLFYYKNRLLVKELDKEQIEKVSPVVGKLYVEKYLDPKYIKKPPNVKLMGRQEYLKYRDEKIDENINEIDELISQAEQNVNYWYGEISNAQNQITLNEQGLNDSIAAQQEDDEYCRTAGYYSYYFDTFYRYYSDATCDSWWAEWDAIIAGYRQNIQDWQNYLSQSRQALAEWQNYVDGLNIIRELVASQKESVPQELGVFEPERDVKIVLESTSQEALADYFSTLIHEYYHYSSFVSDERTLPGFFEEGITEYLARRTVKQSLGTDTNLGYPMTTAIIEEIAKKIPEKELVEVYFTKDEERLIRLLNNEYGDGFYEDSEYYFAAIYYSPLTDETLKFANNIMFKIGGESLSEEDVRSTYSSF